MHDQPLVSVICLCYNHATYVVDSLESVLNQNYATVELIIIDDCSSDNSKETINFWLKNHPNILFLTNETNLGNTKTFNKAFKFAKGDYIIDLAADDMLRKNCICLQVEKFKKSSYKNLGIVYGNAALITQNGQLDSYYFAVDSNQKTIKKRETGSIYCSVVSGGNSICSVSALVKRTVLKQLNGYDETLSYEDLDLWIRASRLYDFDYIDAVLVEKRILKSSLNNQFYNKKNAIARRLNQSTLIILNKAFALNQTKSEDLALQKRVHHQIVHMLQMREYRLAMQFIQLRIAIAFKRRIKY